MGHLQALKEDIERTQLEIEKAERDYDLNRAAELKYGTLNSLQKELTVRRLYLLSKSFEFLI